MNKSLRFDIDDKINKLQKRVENLDSIFNVEIKDMNYIQLKNEIQQRKEKLTNEVDDLCRQLHDNIVNYKPNIAHEIARKIKYIHEYIIKRNPPEEIQRMLDKEAKVYEIYRSCYSYPLLD